MNENNFLRGARILAVLQAGILLVPIVHAQSTAPEPSSRFLFIFDTSHDMKDRVEATQKALNIMLATSMGGHLHAGDSIGVWTFGEELRPKDYPLLNWNPDAAVTIASNLVKFVGQEHYARATHFAVLQPLLNRVIQDSERLTVLIFCDGDGKITGTPFDAAINQAFKEKFDEQKKAREPMIILFRSQRGQYVAGTLTLPPQQVNVPEFPPLPKPTPPSAATAPPTNVPPPAPVVMGSPLIIIGTKVSNHLPPSATNPPTPPPVAEAPATNPAPARATSPVATNAVALAPINPPQPPLPSPKNSDSDDRGFLFIGAGLIGAAIVIGFVLWRRPGRKDSSLITRSMNDPK